LQDAEFIVGLCQQFHCTPSQIENEEAEIIRLMNIIRLGTPEPEGG
jgi:hypothetical protein